LSQSSAEPHQEEREIIERIRNGESHLFCELVKRAQRAAYATVVAILRDEGEAEDAVQEAIAKAWAAFPSFRQDSRFSTWLVQIALNEARMRLRRHRPYLFESLDEVPEHGATYYVPEQLIEWQKIPSVEMEKKSQREALYQALDHLPWIYREVFLLRDVHQLNIKETAAITGLPESTIKTRLLRARLRLRDLLSGSLPTEPQPDMQLQVPPESPHRATWMWVSEYVDGELDAASRAGLESHMAACPFCKSVLDGVRNVIALVQDERAFPVSEGFEKKLLACVNGLISQRV